MPIVSRDYSSSSLEISKHYRSLKHFLIVPVGPLDRPEHVCPARNMCSGSSRLDLSVSYATASKKPSTVVALDQTEDTFPNGSAKCLVSKDELPLPPKENCL